MWEILLLFLLLTLPLIIFLMKSQVLTQKDQIKPIRSQPPGPPRIPIIGNFHQLGSLPHRSFWRLSRKYGPVMLLRLGKVPLIVVSSAEAATEVLKTHDAECCSRPYLTGSARLSYNGLGVASTPYSEHWREVRKVCVLNLFTAKTVKSFRSVREEEIRSLMDSLYQSSQPSNPVDLAEKSMALTANIIFRIAFGKRFGGSGLDNDKFQEIVHRALGVSGSLAASDFFGSVGQDIFLAGVDTSAIVLTWAMAELARNPRAMNKAKDEARSYAAASKGKLAISESNIHQLQYLKMIVKETLRLHPPAPLLLPRETLSQFNLASYEVPPKTLIRVNVWGIGRDPNYWDSPEEFFPERFANSSIDYKGKHFELLPFGSGRRGCPGILMGIATVELALANLLCCFEWKLPDGMKETDINMEEEAGITMYKKSALRLVPITYHWPLDQEPKS